MSAAWWWLRRRVFALRRADEVAEVVNAWAALVAFNPDARTLGGTRSRQTWAALDALACTTGGTSPPDRSSGY